MERPHLDSLSSQAQNLANHALDEGSHILLALGIGVAFESYLGGFALGASAYGVDRLKKKIRSGKGEIKQDGDDTAR